MNRDFEFYHGVVLTRLVHEAQRELSIKSFTAESNSAYIVNGSIGLYVKYSSKRMTPWRFTFTKEHQDEFQSLKSHCTKAFLVLVCHEDGIVCLSESELIQILDEQHDPIEWISATRHKREMYAIKGSNGTLDFKIGKSDFPGKLFLDQSDLPPLPELQVTIEPVSSLFPVASKPELRG